MPKALIIDDDEDLAGIMALMLRKDGFETALAHDGLTGIDKAHSWKPDIAIIDLLMPGIHGFLVVEKLRASEDLKNLPILIASSKPFEEDKFHAKEVGANDYLTKPFKRQQLLDKVHALLRQTP